MVVEKRIPVAFTEKLLKSVENEISRRNKPFRLLENGEIQRIDDVYNRGKVFRDLVKHPYIVGPLISLVGPNIEFALNRHNHATINSTTERRFHRDILQWTRSLITVIVYLEKSTINNGCTEIIPGSQYLPYSGKPNNGGTWLDEDSVYSDLIKQALPIPMEKGGILLFDSLAFHSVGTNTSGSSRKSITLGYHGVDELSYKRDPQKVLIHGASIYRGNIKFQE